MSWWLRGRDRALMVEVRGHLPVLPILRDQLTEARSQMESAVVEICRNFRTMAERATKSVATMSDVLGEDKSDGVAGVLQASRTTIENLLERMRQTDEALLHTVTRMEQVEASMRAIMGSLAEVGRIAFVNKLLALNAKIEAVHVGAEGSGFAVVAGEISAQAERSTEIVEKMERTVKDLSTSILAASSALREQAASDMQHLAVSEMEVRTAIDQMLNSHQEISRVLGDSRESSRRLASEIAQAVMGLQFQDRLGQQISHVVEALESMESALSGGAASGDHPLASTRQEQIVAGLKEKYTMESERAVLEQSGASPSENLEGGDVELF